MSITRRILLIGLVVFGAAGCAARVTAACPPPAGVALQVLGSGGPIADDGRASAGYVVWVDGESRVLVDAGGGTFLRFAEAGASFAALDFLGLSHFHADHSADFVALLKSGNFSSRERPLAVAGPDGAGRFPGLGRYLDSLLRPDGGAYGYLSGYLDGTGGLARLEPVEVGSEPPAPVTVYANAARDLEVSAMHVPHGIVPALAFRVRVGDTSLVFASYQNGSDAAFTGFAEDADVLVMHMPIPEDASGAALELHAKPSRIGEIAATAGAGRLVLSHFMARSLRDLDGNVAIVRDSYGSDVVVAADLLCLPVGR
jgi:ribonuclease BN (tRNA processing enzyme)